MSPVMTSTYVAPLHLARWGLAVTVLNDEIVAAGGCCDVLALAFNQVETFSPVRGKVIAGKWKIGQFRRTTARVTFQAPRAQFAVWRCSGGRSRRCARRRSAEHLIATKALHSHGLDSHCRSVLRDLLTGCTSSAATATRTSNSTEPCTAAAMARTPNLRARWYPPRRNRRPCRLV